MIGLINDFTIIVYYRINHKVILCLFFPLLSLAQAERQAINTIIQGSAADVTKMAMIKVDKAINQSLLSPHIHLIMHLHDELIFEVLNLFIVIFCFHSKL